MKFNSLVFVLVLAVVSWAQSSTPVAQSTAKPDSPAGQSGSGCSCCATMNHGEGHAHACGHHAADADDKHAGCCSGMDSHAGMSCMKNMKDGGDAKDMSASKGADDKDSKMCMSGDHGAGCCGGKDEKS